MLMLSRKTNESILIGDDIRVVITRIGRGRVQVAIDAPRDVRIRREELPASLDTFTLASAVAPSDLAGIDMFGDVVAG
ncbi:MAG: carbon storage regulator [Pirellulales bacterium]